jgi:peroxiredoxin
MAHRKIGQILIAEGHLTPQQVDELLAIQKNAKNRRQPHKRLGELAIEKRMIAPTQMRWALEAQAHEDNWLKRGVTRIFKWTLAAAVLYGGYKGVDYTLSKFDLSRPGNQAPAFKLENAQRPGEVRLADFRGRVVLLNFFSPDCTPCQNETPELTALQATYRQRGFSVLGIILLYSEIGAGGARELARSPSIGYPVLLGTTATSKAYMARDLPMSLLIDRQGKIVKRWKDNITQAMVEDEIEKLL